MNENIEMNTSVISNIAKDTHIITNENIRLDLEEVPELSENSESSVTNTVSNPSSRDSPNVMNTEDCNVDNTEVQEQVIKMNTGKNSHKEEVCLELKTIQYKTSLLQHKYELKPTISEKVRKVKNIDDIPQQLEIVTSNAKSKPISWNRLEKMQKMKKLSEFSEKYIQENELEDSLAKELFSYLKTSLERKKLASTKVVLFDKETNVIKEIVGLEYIVNNIANNTTKSKTHRFTLKSGEKRQSSLKNLGLSKKRKQTRNGKQTKQKTVSKVSKNAKKKALSKE